MHKQEKSAMNIISGEPGNCIHPKKYFMSKHFKTSKPKSLDLYNIILYFTMI